jgi:phosphoglycolate phosphatase-like HAD superfamily hydrolase
MIFAFDLDGTLITARQRQMTLLQAIARRFDVKLDSRAIWHQKREGLSTQKALEDAGLSRAKATKIAYAWLQNIEAPFWLSLDTLFPDTVDVLESFRGSGGKLILLTARQNRLLLLQQLLRLGIGKCFDDIECVSPFAAVDEKAGVLFSQDVDCFVGDSETDFRAAKMARVPFYAVSTGQRSSTFLAAQGIANIHGSLPEVRETIFATRLE